MAETLTDGELTVLGLLLEQPRHGYDLERVIEERGMRAWIALGFSSIYYVLDKLAARGLIETTAKQGKSRATYRATPAGRQLCESATREALTALTPIRSRVLIAMANSPGLADEDVAAGLAERLAALRNQLTHVQDARRGQEPLSAAATAIFDYSEAMLRADIGWTESLVGKAGGMDKYDVKKAYRKLYAPPAKDFVVVDVPVFRYIAVDGQGDPNTSTAYAQAVESLFGVAYTVKFASKKQLDRDFTVGPLEALWRADDPSAFTKRDKSAWAWTVMIHQPDWVTDDIIAAAVEAVGKKKEPADVRQLTLEEGRCVQILHIGPYDDEGPTLDRLHNRYMPDNGLEFNGDHHEIYLSDVRRTAPEKLKTILRQPVKRA